ncbi:MAG: carbonic anhydrase [Candidatus Obscuribacterales bacterium]|nr:carbonic anhydrase [Candidatus Obscuribacterales bacterium]
MKAASLAAIALVLGSSLACYAETPQQVWDRLKEGNKRYLGGKSIHPRFDAAKRQQTALNGQKPIATILGCADARVPPEVVFDQGFGDLFVVRVAGNVCAIAELASIEYGVKYVKTPLVVVLGHTQCGAVDGAVRGAELKGSLPKLMALITPTTDKTKKNHPELKGKDLLNAAIEDNVRNSISEIKKNSPGLTDLVKQKKLLIVGGIRNIENGTIRWLDAKQ